MEEPQIIYYYQQLPEYAIIIENLMGITGGNITLKKLVQNLSKRNLKISILMEPNILQIVCPNKEHD